MRIMPEVTVQLTLRHGSGRRQLFIEAPPSGEQAVLMQIVRNPDHDFSSFHREAMRRVAFEPSRSSDSKFHASVWLGACELERLGFVPDEISLMLCAPVIEQILAR